MKERTGCMRKYLDDPALLRIILSTMNDGVMVVDPDGKIMVLNPAAEKLTGYREREVRGKPCTILDTDTCVFMSGTTVTKRCDVFKKGKVANKRCRIKSKDGRNVMLLKNAKVLKDGNGNVIGAVETMTDVTSLFIKETEIEKLCKELRHEYGFMGLIGKSQPMMKVYEQIENAAQSDVPVIIIGESGTGKELVAEAVHRMSDRKKAPFVRVNCAALNEHLLESELFGHRKGSFTGAIRDRAGRFEAAHKGSIFLDEIGDMPASMQVKLLRVLQQKEVERIGDNHPIVVDVRIITATNRDLSSLVGEGKFREDLYYRVNVFPIYLPALRERLEDLPLIALHYLEKISIVNGKKITSISPKAFDALKRYHWPGNVRQLVNAIEYAAITCSGDEIDIDHLPDYISTEDRLDTRRSHADQRERRRVMDALKKHNFNRNRTAEYLGISRVGLWKKLKKLGISL